MAKARPGLRCLMMLALTSAACSPDPDSPSTIRSTDYALNVGEGEFYGTSHSGMTLSYLNGFDTLRDSWGQIVAHTSKSGSHGDDTLLFYDPDHHHAEFHHVSHGVLSFLGQYNNWRSSWTAIVAGNFDTGTNGDELLFYDRSTGEAEIYRQVGPNFGTGMRLVASVNLGRWWTAVKAGKFDDAGADGVLLFKPGEIALYSNTGDGNLFHNRTYPTLYSITRVATGRFFDDNRYTDVLLWVGSQKRGYFYEIDHDGIATYRSTVTSGAADWSELIVGNYHERDGLDDLLAYDRANGDGFFFTSDGEGGLVPLRTFTNWRSTWLRIVPGTYGGAFWTADLFFYDPNL